MQSAIGRSEFGQPQKELAVQTFDSYPRAPLLSIHSSNKVTILKRTFTTFLRHRPQRIRPLPSRQ